MKKTFLILSIIVTGSFYSCSLKSDPELGEFKDFESFIDMSLKNLFDPSLLYNEWIRSKVISQVYYDGVLIKEEDVTNEWGFSCIILRNDNTIKIGDASGRWLYSHNYLMWTPGYHEQEVIWLDKEKLHLKKEDYPVGMPYKPFFVDKGGEHHFHVFEYLAR